MKCHIQLSVLMGTLVLILSVAGCGSSSTDPDGGDGNGGGNNGGTELNQDGPWMWANPAPTGDPVYRVKYASEKTAYAVTGGGAVLKSTDAGESWELAYRVYEATAHSPSSFFGLHFLSEDEGWVVGTNGQVSYTNNGGGSWSDRSIVTSQSLRDVFFYDAMNGVTVGDRGSLYRTTDGGMSWTPIAHSAGTAHLNAVAFNDANSGWIGGDEEIALHSDDGGLNWTQINSTWRGDITVGHPMEGGGVIFGTRQGAVIAMTSPTSWSFPLVADVILDAHFGDTENGTVLYTDGGESFLGVRTNGNWTHHRLQFAETALSFDLRGSSVAIGGWWGMMQHSSNSGLDWMDAYEVLDTDGGSATQLLDVAFDGGFGIAVGMNGTILRSEDAGVSWDVRSSGTQEEFRGAWVIGNKAFAVGLNSTLLRSVDGGQSWDAMTTEGDAQTFHALCMWNEVNGIVAGAGLQMTDDGGLTWTERSTPFPDQVTAYFAASVVGTTHAWVGARGGHVMRTIDGGENWTLHDTGASRAIQSIHFVNETHGWAGTHSQEFVYTIDGGENWVEQSLPGSAHDVMFGSEMVGIVVGPTGGVWGTSDGGMTWDRQHSGLMGFSHVRAIHMSSVTDAVIVGTESKILYTRTAGNLPSN